MEKYKPFIKDLIHFYYNDLGNGSGGKFHVVLDDGNIEDETVFFCQEEAAKANDTFAVFLGKVLREFTENEREQMFNDNWGMY